MQKSIVKLKTKDDVFHITNTLLRQEKHLDDALAEITVLIRGNVAPEDTIRRSTIGSYFSGILQQVNNFVDKHHISLTKKRKEHITRLIYKADKVLRENIVLQTKPPLDVISFKNVPVRYSYSTYGKREQRWGYALHKKPFNEEGNSVTVANMPPKYTQSIHNHIVSEYCLILDTKTEGIFFPGGKREKIYTTTKSQILHFSATTPHTLRNPLTRYGRNITYKQSAALTDWKPASRLNEVKIIRARLIKGKVERINPTQTHKVFRIHDTYYKYSIEVIRLDKGSSYENVHNYDQYIFVINGNLTIKHNDLVKHCKKNDFIVIDKNTEYSIQANTFCRLYTVSE